MILTYIVIGIIFAVYKIYGEEKLIKFIYRMRGFEDFGTGNWKAPLIIFAERMSKARKDLAFPILILTWPLVAVPSAFALYSAMFQTPCGPNPEEVRQRKQAKMEKAAAKRELRKLKRKGKTAPNFLYKQL
jgi:hypothetical protein